MLSNKRVAQRSALVAKVASLLLLSGAVSSFAATGEDKTRLTKPGSEPESSSEVYGDWVLQCRAVQAEGLPPRLCEVTQPLRTTMQGAEGAQPQVVNLGQMAIGRVRSSDPYNLTVLLPTDVSFPGKVALSLDASSADSLTVNWARCMPSGCYATLKLDDGLLKRLLQSNAAGKLQWQIASGQSVQLAVSFRGLAQAFAQLGQKTPK